MTHPNRQRTFMVAAPLAIIPALIFLPAVMFLIAFPQVTHGRLIGFLLLPPFLLAEALGLWKLSVGTVEKPWGIFNTLSFSAVMVLLVIAGYTGLFLALITLRM